MNRCNDCGAGCSNGAVYTPTPEEIAQRAAEVRRGWSDAIERQRTVQHNPPASAPLVSVILDREASHE